jgi:hypothetical protein
MGLSRQSRKVTSSSIATIWKEWNLIALPKVRKWSLRRVRDVMAVRKPIRCDLPKLKHPMLVEMTRVEMTKVEMTRVEMTKVEMTRVEMTRVEMTRAEMTRVEMTRVEVRTRSKHSTTHLQGLITLNP